MYECEIFEVPVEGVGAMYGIRCGDVYKLLSLSLIHIFSVIPEFRRKHGYILSLEHVCNQFKIHISLSEMQIADCLLYTSRCV